MLQILNVLLWNACLAGGLAIVIFFVQRIQYLRSVFPCLKTLSRSKP
jgi:hypothetical protein